MKKLLATCGIGLFFLIPSMLWGQLHWQNVDDQYLPLPECVHVFKTNDSLEGKPNIAYYVTVPLASKQLAITAEIGKGKRFTPTQYFQAAEKPLLVMNCTFFEFAHNSNLNVVMKNGQLVAQQLHSIPDKGKDTLLYHHYLGSALGISKKGKADVAWVYTDSAEKYPYATQVAIAGWKDSANRLSKKNILGKGNFKKWKMETAVGGGPVLLQQGMVNITNNEEGKFAGKAINDKHPKTAIGYTAKGDLILMVIAGRFPGKAEGATLVQEATLLQEVGCWEALNLDGGGSSCLLINGKETITPSDKEGQRPVPAVLLVHQKKPN